MLNRRKCQSFKNHFFQNPGKKINSNDFKRFKNIKRRYLKMVIPINSINEHNISVLVFSWVMQVRFNRRIILKRFLLE